MPDAIAPRTAYDAFLITDHHDFCKPAVAPQVIGLGLGRRCSPSRSFPDTSSSAHARAGTSSSPNRGLSRRAE